MVARQPRRWPADLCGQSATSLTPLLPGAGTGSPRHVWWHPARPHGRPESGERLKFCDIYLCSLQLLLCCLSVSVNGMLADQINIFFLRVTSELPSQLKYPEALPMHDLTNTMIGNNNYRLFRQKIKTHVVKHEAKH